MDATRLLEMVLPGMLPGTVPGTVCREMLLRPGMLASERVSSERVGAMAVAIVTAGEAVGGIGIDVMHGRRFS